MVTHRTERGHVSRTFDACSKAKGDLLDVASCGEDGTVLLWKTETDPFRLVEAGCVRTEGASMLRVRWTPKEMDGFSTASDDGYARVWRADVCSVPESERYQCVSELGPHEAEVYGCEYLAEDAAKMITCSSNVVCKWNVSEESILAKRKIVPTSDNDVPIRWKQADVFGCASSEDGKVVACTCSDGTVHLLDAGQDLLNEFHASRIHQSMACACAFDGRGQDLASVDVRGGIRIFDRRTNRVRLEHDIGSAIYGCAYFTHEGVPILLCSAKDGCLYAFRTEGARLGTSERTSVLEEGCSLLCCTTSGSWTVASGEAKKDASFGPFVCRRVVPREASLYVWDDIMACFETSVRET